MINSHFTRIIRINIETSNRKDIDNNEEDFGLNADLTKQCFELPHKLKIIFLNMRNELESFNVI